MIQKIDHIGIAVSDLDEALKLYRDMLGLKVDHIEDFEGMKIAFIPYQVLLMLPYIVILFSLIVNRKELGKPAMLGVPFKKST